MKEKYKEATKIISAIIIIVALIISLITFTENNKLHTTNNKLNEELQNANNQIALLNRKVKNLSSNPLYYDGVIDLSETVYITSSGSKYHKKGCSYLKSSIKTTRYAAEATKYTPCSRCRP